MRILLWHGYLLGGTGSNVYTRALAREWSLAGHEVVLFSQERHPERLPFVDLDSGYISRAADAVPHQTSRQLAALSLVQPAV